MPTVFSKEINMAKNFKGAVKYLVGNVFGRKGAQIDSQTEAWKQEADCGCGIDCCNNKIVLRSQDTKAVYELTIVAGVLTVTAQ